MSCSKHAFQAIKNVKYALNNPQSGGINNKIQSCFTASKMGILDVPYTFPVWKIQDSKGNTPAHYMAELGKFYAPYKPKLWKIHNCTGKRQHILELLRGVFHHLILQTCG